ncbi:hypothetical protein P9597_10720 [Aneurinibacillus migulanus]|uniref:hypothetical protein n=1 Tax=Aneurinibacillus migulanus TaxID=47500 RepID=UPI002E23E780|nr:hypothetical protein [Aneurinibacillus migulanus]
MLKRVEMSWDNVLDFTNLNIPQLEAIGCNLTARQNRYTESKMLVSVTRINVENTATIMNRIRHMTGARCTSLKFYFEPEEQYRRSSIVPIDELERLGFELTHQNIWVFRQHPDFSIAAIAIPTYSECEWVLQIDKRNGDGVPATACNYMKLFNEQMKLVLEAGVA